MEFLLMHVIIIANANVWSPYPLLCPLPICLSHLPPNFFPTLHFVSAGLRAAKRSQPGQKSVVKTFSGQKAGGLEAACCLVGLETRHPLIPITDRNAAGIFMRLRGGSEQNKHLRQRCSNERIGEGVRESYRSFWAEEAGVADNSQSVLELWLWGLGSKCSRQPPFCSRCFYLWSCGLPFKSQLCCHWTQFCELVKWQKYDVASWSKVVVEIGGG